MKIPKIFLPEKNLDEKTKNLVKDLVSPNSFNELIRDKIGNYNKNKEYYPDKSLPEYKYMTSAVECASLYYDYHSPEIIRLTIFRFDKPAKDCLNEVINEVSSGHFQIYKNMYYTTKNEFAVIITTLEDTPEEQEGLELFKKHYQEKFGFC